MSLKKFKKEMASISGVKSVRLIENDILQVRWFGKPADYRSQIRSLRNKYPNITQIEAPDDKPKQTPDVMPIQYYTE